MIRKLLIGAGVSGAVIAAAVALDAGHLAPYVKTLNAAQGLDVTYTVSEVGGAQSQFHVVLAKPNKAMIETPTTTYVADGQNLTVYDKKRNSYYTKAQTEDSIKELFGDEEVSIWKAFFDAKAFDSAKNTKSEGTKTFRGETLKSVSAQVGEGNDYSVRLHLSTQDNLVRQAELTTKAGARETVKVVNVAKISTTMPADALFAFNAPSGAKQLTEADMVAAEWTTDLAKALEMAKALGKGVMVDFYADW